MRSFRLSSFYPLGGRLAILLAAVLVLASCKKDDDSSNNNNNNNNTEQAMVLVISTGSISTNLDGAPVTYSAILAKADGSFSTADNVTWSSSETGVATINSSGTVTYAGPGVTYITASRPWNGITLTCTVPLRVVAEAPFTVVPWAYIGQPGETVQFESVYHLTTGGTAPASNFSYSSSATSIATVNSSGLMSLVANGECVITVTYTANGQTLTQTVPVLVVSAPNVPLPITRVKVNPGTYDFFRGDQHTFTAQAFNSNNEDVTSTASFTWATSDAEVATVGTNGQVTAVGLGEAVISATANGIRGEAVIAVYPDTVVIIDPFYVSLSGGQTRQFTATVINARTNTVIAGAPITWELLTIPGFDMFNIGTINTTTGSTTTFTMNQNATMGFSTFLGAYVTGNPDAGGVASIMVSIGTGSDCGTGNADVASINITNGTAVTLDFFNSSHQINATALDALGNQVGSPDLHYNSDNIQVASVDFNGMITIGGTPGTATITVCSGNFASATVTVTVNP